MAVLADLSGLQTFVDQVASRVEKEGAALVIGLPGTGRSTLVKELQQQVEGAHTLLLPQEDVDAPAQVLGQSASRLEHAEDRRKALQDEVVVEKRALAVAARLAEQGVTLVVPLPATWRLDQAEVACKPEAFEARRRVRSILKAFVENKDLKLVFVQDSRFSDEAPYPDPRFGEAIRLPWVKVLWEALDDEECWGDLADAAQKVLEMRPDLEERAGGSPSPIALRLAVGAVWLGWSPADVKSQLRQPDAVSGLALTLAKMLRRRYRSADGQATRLSQVAMLAARGRLPLPRSEALELLNMRPGEEPFLTEVLCYGERLVRMSDAVRLAFSGRRREDVDREQQHAALAGLYATMDGQADFAEVGPRAAPYWLERLHQAAHAGDLCFEEWNRMAEATGQLPRELIWDRARALSRDRRYREATTLYAQCIERHPEDAYSWHYDGYNRIRAGEGLATARPRYERAVELEPWNPRWNERLVSLLIGQGLPDSAEQAWARALESIPGAEPPRHWLALHLHSNVARKWLDQGFPDRAERVLRRVAPEVIEQDRQLFELRQRIQDALEAMELRESVYPPDYWWERRWQDPGGALPEVDASRGRRLAWHPARVLARSTDSVEVVFADFDPDKPPPKIQDTWRRDLSTVELFTRSVPADEWEEAGGDSAALARGYWFIGVYVTEGSKTALRLVSAEDRAGQEPPPAGYWQRWIRSQPISRR